MKTQKQRIFSLLVLLTMAAILTCIFAACDKTDTQNPDFKVTIHPNNGQADIVWDIATDIPSITKDGYLLVGYYFDKNFTENVSIESLIKSKLTKNIDIYAKWEKYSEGLQYVLNEDANGYTVTSIGTCVNVNIVIPSKYNSLPVTKISTNAFKERTTIVSIIIPESIKRIDDYAFSGCTGLTVVTIGKNVEYIGNRAFMGCTGLTTVNWNAKACHYNSSSYYSSYRIFYGCGKKLDTINIGEYVSSIPSDAFYDCYGLTSVHITNLSKWCEISFGNEFANPLYYAHKLYLGDELLTSFTIPNDVTVLSKYLFAGFLGLEDIIIPDSVMSINGAFDECKELRKIDVSINNTAFASVDGILYDKAKTRIICVPLAIQGAVSIPDSVMTIEQNAFSNRYGITEIRIGNSVSEIGRNAFYNCNKLKGVTVGNKVRTIGDSAFDNCANLESVHITDLANWFAISFSNGTSNPVYYAHNLYLNDKLVEDLVVPENITSIGQYAFVGCSTLNSVSIPNGVTDIGISAFDKCERLTGVYIEDIAKWCVVRFSNETSNPLYYAHLLYFNQELMTELIIPGDVENINPFAFYNCNSLISVTIFDDLISIGHHSFSNCKKLTSITIGSNVASIGDGAFENCDGLKSVNIHDISNWCAIDFASETSNPLFYAHKLFVNNELIVELVIPNNVQNIKKFSFCGGAEFKSIIIGNSVTNIDIGAFNGCSSLEHITIPFIGSRANVKDTDAYQYPFGYIFGENAYQGGLARYQQFIGESTHYIYHGTYYIPASLKSVKVTDDNIRYGAFYNCSMLTSIEIPNDVTIIGGSAFYCCNSLTSIAIPNTVENIGRDAFYGCDNLAYSVYGTAQYLGNETNPYIVLIKALPSSTDTYKINESCKIICNNAFKECTSLTSIKIPSNVIRISDSAFYKCENLVHLSFDINSTLKYIDDSTFYECAKLTSITIPNSIEKIGKSAFYNCTRLSSVTFGDYSRLIDIGRSAFYRCEKLSSLTVPDSVTRIGQSAFEDCLALKTVYFSENSVLRYIDDRAFYGCISLVEVTIPNNVTEIGAYSFAFCEIATINIPKGVTSIGEYAFCGCDKLTSVVFDENCQLNRICEGAFSQCTSLTSIIIPNSVTRIDRYAFRSSNKLVSVTFENTTGWYVFYSSYGTKYQVDVDNARANASDFTSTYRDYYWEKG